MGDIRCVLAGGGGGGELWETDYSRLQIIFNCYDVAKLKENNNNNENAEITLENRTNQKNKHNNIF